MQTPRPVLISILALAVVAAVPVSCGGPVAEEERPLIVENPYVPANQDDGPPVTFEIDRIYGAEESPSAAILESVQNVVVDEEGMVYVLDGGNRIVSFAPDGTVRWEMSRQGEGPGELNNPRGMYRSAHGLLHVMNQAGRRIDIYDLDGNHTGAVNPEDFGHNRIQLRGFANDSTAVATISRRGMLGAHILILDTGDSWSVRHEIVIDQTGDTDIPERMSGTFSFVAPFGEGLIVSNVGRYEFTVMDLKGDTLRIIRRDVPTFTRPGFANRAGRFSMSMISSISDFVRLRTGHILVTSIWPEDRLDPDQVTLAGMEGNWPDFDSHESFDIYDEDWRLVYEFEGEAFDQLELGSPLLTGPDGHLYTSQYSPYPRLVRNAVFESDN